MNKTENVLVMKVMQKRDFNDITYRIKGTTYHLMNMVGYENMPHYFIIRTRTFMVIQD
jgi:hypothetical protein